MQTIITGRYRILLPVVLFIYLVWWIFIVLGNFPETSLPIAANLAHYKTFDAVFYQRWGFFAPPPNEDDRLYYIFTSNKDSSQTITYEIFEKLLKQKQEKYLLNDDLSNLDYILYNTVSPIEDILRDRYEVFKRKHACSDQDKGCGYEDFLKATSSDYNNLPSMITLIKHADMVRQNQGLDIDYSVRIVCTKLSIHRFAQRFSSKPRDEHPFFKSDLYNLKEKKWKKFTD